MRIKNILKWLITIVQIALVIFAVVINYLSDKKMGLVRHFSYQNFKWDGMGLDKIILWILIFIFSMLIITAVIRYKKSLNYPKFTLWIGAAALAIVFSIVSDTEALRTYYVFTLASAIILAIELVKVNFLIAKK